MDEAIILTTETFMGHGLPSEDGGLRPMVPLTLFTLFALFDVTDDPVMIGDHVKVLTPTSRLPDVITEANLLKEEEEIKLNNGTMVSHLIRFRTRVGESNLQAIQRFVEEFDEKKEKVVDAYKALYAMTGRRMSGEFSADSIWQGG